MEGWMDVRMYQKELQEVGEGGRDRAWHVGGGEESSPKGPFVIIERGGQEATFIFVSRPSCVDIMVRVENRVPFACLKPKATCAVEKSLRRSPKLADGGGRSDQGVQVEVAADGDHACSNVTAQRAQRQRMWASSNLFFSPHMRRCNRHTIKLPCCNLAIS